LILCGDVTLPLLLTWWVSKYYWHSWELCSKHNEYFKHCFSTKQWEYWGKYI